MEATTTPIPRRRPRRLALALAATVGASTFGTLLPGGTAHATNLPLRPVLVSRDAAGSAALGGATDPALSGDARYVAFATTAKLVPEDTDGVRDIYLKDRLSGKVERISVSSAEVGGNGNSFAPSVSDDGKRISFLSEATNLAGTDVHGKWDVFVRDRVAGTTVRASVTTSGGELTQYSTVQSISGNGRYVVFETDAPGVVAGDTNGVTDVFVRDLQTSTTERVSVSTLEGQAVDLSTTGSISDDGRYVAFRSVEELAGGQLDGTDIYVRDRTAGSTTLVSVSSSEALGTGNAQLPVISGNGRYVAFGSFAPDLVAGDSNGNIDVFRRDLVAGETIRVSVHDNDAQLGFGGNASAISDDGSQVAFETTAVATTTADAGSDDDIFVRSVPAASTRRASTSPVVDDPAGAARDGVLSDDGTVIGFTKQAPGLLASGHPAGTNQVYLTESMQIGPFATIEAFISQQHQDFTGLAPLAPVAAEWKAKLQDGRATPASFIATLAGADSFAKTRGSVVRLYWAFFLRKPDPSGLSYWIKKKEDGASLASIAQKFAQSSEFENRYGSLTNQQFVKLIYPNIFDRQPDPSGLAYWTAKLDSKAKTRGDVMVNFSESSEGKRRLAPQVHITLISQGMLRVSPSPTFWDQAFAVYQGGEKELAWLADQVLRSSAYAARF